MPAFSPSCAFTRSSSGPSERTTAQQKSEMILNGCGLQGMGHNVALKSFTFAWKSSKGESSVRPLYHDAFFL
eukprot:CAMPEP_0195108366 /NCGR_PEP_ID=MMETSP0448-20130528/84867_1 /TAXON_ID=66468 /ORGANISM="Heterocapsa triquestra, Strain CCMP 448" /LENGTH=71 /DNA_ID=CAMNT_0040144889 /DNA_START=25 /DNA_END=237 /DNA_ORIENTATION=-